MRGPVDLRLRVTPQRTRWIVATWRAARRDLAVSRPGVEVACVDPDGGGALSSLKRDRKLKRGRRETHYLDRRPFRVGAGFGQLVGKDRGDKVKRSIDLTQA